VINVKAYLLKSFRRQLFLDLKSKADSHLTGQLNENQFEYFNGAEQVISEKRELKQIERVIKKSLVNSVTNSGRSFFFAMIANSVMRKSLIFWKSRSIPATNQFTAP
jgi:hypothetical protein